MATPTVLTFEQFYTEMIDHALEVKALNSEHEAKGGEIQQASAFPNPELAVGLDTIGKDVDGDENELSIELTQVIEMGGKRSARMRVAEADECATAWDIEILKQSLYAQSLNAFIDIAITQELVALALAQHKVAALTFECSKTRNSAGKASILEAKKAEVACRNANLQLSKQRTTLASAKQQLVILWDGAPLQFDQVDFPLYEISLPPPLMQLLEDVVNNPILAKRQAELVRTWQIIELERAQQIPDIAVQIGVITERFYREPTLNVGFDIPLPIFDQNKGSIRRAISEYNQAYYLQESATKQLKASLTILHAEWMAAFTYASEIKNNILPPAEEAYSLSLESYRQGKSDYLNLLDASSMLFDIKRQYLQGVDEYHHKRAEILKLTRIN